MTNPLRPFLLTVATGTAALALAAGPVGAATPTATPTIAASPSALPTATPTLPAAPASTSPTPGSIQVPAGRVIVRSTRADLWLPAGLAGLGVVLAAAGAVSLRRR